MSSFNAKAGLFWLNEQPELIQAGEFHYFRTPKDQWRQRLELLKGAGFNALAAYIPWLWHQLEEDSSDFDGHSHPMRDLEAFLDLASDMGLYIIARPGPYIMAETRREGIPDWVFEKYPQVAFISQENKVQDIASYLHPDFLRCVKKWYQAIFGVLVPRQITRGGKIIMIQLDNEMGMMAWVRNIIDTNPDTMSRFGAYLQATYGDQVRERYPADDLAEFLQSGIRNPVEPYAAKIVEDYRRFYRDYLREYAAYLLSEAVSCGLEVMPVINIHGFANGGKTFPIGLSQLISVLRMDEVISATDVYPGFIGEGNFHQLLLVNEMTKALQNKKQPLFSVEFQAGGNHDFGNGQASLYDLHSRLCISSGMRAINHYLFCDGENDPLLSPVKRHDWGHPVRKDGSLRKHYFRYPQLSRVLKSYGADLVEAFPQAVTSIGFLLDTFMTEVNNPFTRADTDIITHQREVILFDFIARGLALTQRAFNALDLENDPLDASRVPLCWVMMEKQCNADVQQKLVDYLAQGGRLVLAGRLPSEEFHHLPCTILKDALGITQVNDDPPFVPANINVFDHQDVPVSFVESYSGHFDEVFARRENGEVVGFVQGLGRGKIIVFGAAVATNTLDDLDILQQMALKMDCPAPFKTSDWVDIRLSRGEKGAFLYINNYQDDPVEATIEYEHADLLGGNPVHLPARRGQILPVEWQLNKDVLVHYVTSEIVERRMDEEGLQLRTDQDEFYAEISLSGYACDQGTLIAESGGRKRIRLHGKDGLIILRKE